MSSLEPLDAPVRQARSLARVDHRPWQLPEGAWAQGQTWNDVLFAHWRAERERLRRLLPPELELELYDGSAWLGVVAFRVTSTRVRGLPPVPFVSTFGQLNVRTYVTDGERPGIWFFSVRVTSRLVVEAMKRFYRLPAVRARVAVSPQRVDADGFEAAYVAAGAGLETNSGTLEHFLVERYCQYTADGGRLYRAQVHHAPWHVWPAEGSVAGRSLAPAALEGDPHLLAATRQDALVWPLEEG